MEITEKSESQSIHMDEQILVNRILVVDDEENVLFTISSILEQDGYTVETASSGEEALEKLTGKTFDLVLTDMRMESSSGLDVLDNVQKLSPSTVSIVLTGYASLESAIGALRHNAYDYLIKPCLIEDLKQTVKRGLERRRLELIAKQREQQLEEVNRNLERMVEARTQQLGAANSELKEKNQQIENFVYLISHDLRSPIVSIQGLAGVLKEEYQEKLADGDGLSYLELIQKNAVQMSALIDDLLEFLRVGRSKLDFRKVDSDELAREVWASYNSLNHGVTLKIKGRLPIVWSDPHKLSQIFSNLFDNAIKYRGAVQSPKVEICCEENDINWHFMVNNNGLGFEPRHNEKIFELFQRLTEVHDKPGSGIGLPIVRKLSQLHGGHAWAEGRPGDGSTFHFTLSRPSQGSSSASKDGD